MSENSNSTKDGLPALLLHLHHHRHSDIADHAEAETIEFIENFLSFNDF